MYVTPNHPVDFVLNDTPVGVVHVFVYELDLAGLAFQYDLENRLTNGADISALYKNRRPHTAN